MEILSANNKVYLFTHIIWSVKNRQPLLSKPIRKVLFSHIQKNAEEKGIKVLIVNGIEDHIHCLVQLHPAQNLSQIIKFIKGESSHWLNESKLIASQFEWQDGYAAYSVSPLNVKNVLDYIYKQEQHHQVKNFEQEMKAFDKVEII